MQHPQIYDERLITSNAAPIAVSVWRPAAPKQAVVFVPGTGVHPLFYEEFLDALAGTGRVVVGVHPRGHGKSPRVPGVLRWHDLVSNAVDASTWTAETFRLPVVMIGSSQGSLVALLAAAQGAPARGVVAHNLFDPNDPESAMVTRFGALRGTARQVRRVMDVAADLAPRLPVPITGYLNPDRVFGTTWTRELFDLDPLVLRSYPLRFLADLVSVDTRGLYDGSLTVPVMVLAARGDPLFPLDGIRAVVDRLRAPSVDLVVLDTDCHLVLNEALSLALPPVLAGLEVLATPAAVNAGAQ